MLGRAAGGGSGGGRFAGRRRPARPARPPEDGRPQAEPKGRTAKRQAHDGREAERRRAGVCGGKAWRQSESLHLRVVIFGIG